MQILVDKLLALRPDLLCVGKAVSRHAQDHLTRHGVALMQHVKPEVGGWVGGWVDEGSLFFFFFSLLYLLILLSLSSLSHTNKQVLQRLSRLSGAKILASTGNYPPTHPSHVKLTFPPSIYYPSIHVFTQSTHPPTHPPTPDHVMTQHGARAVGVHCGGFRLRCFPLEKEGGGGGRGGGGEGAVSSSSSSTGGGGKRDRGGGEQEGGGEGGGEGGEDEDSLSDLPPPVFASPHHNTRARTYAYIEGRYLHPPTHQPTI